MYVLGGVSICLFALVLIHFAYKTFVPLEEAQTYADYRIKVYALCFAFALIGFLTRHQVEPYFFVFLIVITLFLVTANSFRVHEQSGRLRHTEQHMNKFALMVVLFIGEGILALVMTPEALSTHVPTSYYTAAFMALGIMYNVKNIYQASQPIDQDGHALYNSNAMGSVMWFQMHIPLAVFILFTNSAYKILFMYAPKAGGSWKLDPAYYQFLGVSLMLTVLCCYAIRLPHKSFSPSFNNSALRLLLAVLIPVGSAFGFDTPGYLAWCLVCVLFLSAIDYTDLSDADIVVLSEADRPIHHHDKAFISQMLHLDKPLDKVMQQRPETARTFDTDGNSRTSSEAARAATPVAAKEDEVILITPGDEGEVDVDAGPVKM